MIRLTPLAALVLLCACTAPGQRSLVASADQDSISLRGHSTWVDEMARVAERHCAQYGKQSRMYAYRYENAQTDWLYTAYRCV